MYVKKSACVMRTISAYRGKIKDLACKRNSRIQHVMENKNPSMLEEKENQACDRKQKFKHVRRK